VVLVATPEHCACESRAEQIVRKTVNSSNVGFIADKVVQSWLVCQ